MMMTLNHVAAIYRFGRLLEDVDGPPNEARKQHLRDFVKLFNLPDDTFELVKHTAEDMSNDKALLFIKDLDKETKLMLTNLYANIVCTDDKLTEKGQAFVSEIVLVCNLPIPGAEDQWEEAIQENLPNPNAPLTPSFILVHPDGDARRRESQHEDWRELDKDIAEWIGASRTEVVRYTAPLNEISERLRLKGYHLVMVVDRNGRTSGAADNMTGTILYGGQAEIMGNIIIALETDDFKLKGFHNISIFNDALYAIDDRIGNLLHLEFE